MNCSPAPQAEPPFASPHQRGIFAITARSGMTAMKAI